MKLKNRITKIIEKHRKSMNLQEIRAELEIIYRINVDPYILTRTIGRMVQDGDVLIQRDETGKPWGFNYSLVEREVITR